MKCVFFLTHLLVHSIDINWIFSLWTVFQGSKQLSGLTYIISSSKNVFLPVLHLENTYSFRFSSKEIPCTQIISWSCLCASIWYAINSSLFYSLNDSVFILPTLILWALVFSTPWLSSVLHLEKKKLRRVKKKNF